MGHTAGHSSATSPSFHIATSRCGGCHDGRSFWRWSEPPGADDQAVPALRHQAGISLPIRDRHNPRHYRARQFSGRSPPSGNNTPPAPCGAACCCGHTGTGSLTGASSFPSLPGLFPPCHATTTAPANEKLTEWPESCRLPGHARPRCQQCPLRHGLLTIPTEVALSV